MCLLIYLSVSIYNSTSILPTHPPTHLRTRIHTLIRTLPPCDILRFLYLQHILNRESLGVYSFAARATYLCLHIDVYLVVVVDVVDVVAYLYFELRTKVDHLAVKMTAIASSLDVPVCVLFATEVDKYRKPNTGMWHFFVDTAHDGQPIDIRASFYVGRRASLSRSSL